MKTKLNMEERPLSELHPVEYNPKVTLVLEDEEYQQNRRSMENSRKKTQNLYEPKVIAQLFNFEGPRRICR